MTLPILLFYGGTHANFLSRCLSISSGTIEKFNLWEEKYGAHANKNFKKIINQLLIFSKSYKSVINVIEK